jgi:TIR domain
MPTPINIYCCYHNNDKEAWEDLESHLAVLKRNGQIVTLDCLNISPGNDREYERGVRLVAANIVLLIISKHFVSDDLCWNMMEQAIERYQTGKLRVVPIRYRPVYYDSAPFAELSMLPKGNPISRWDDPDEAYKNIVEGIIELVDSLHEEKNIKNSTQVFTSRVYEQSKQLTLEPLDTTKLTHIPLEGLEQ